MIVTRRLGLTREVTLLDRPGSPAHSKTFIGQDSNRCGFDFPMRDSPGSPHYFRLGGQRNLRAAGPNLDPFGDVVCSNDRLEV